VTPYGRRAQTSYAGVEVLELVSCDSNVPGSYPSEWLLYEFHELKKLGTESGIDPNDTSQGVN